MPAEDREREERIATEQAADRPENVRERIVTGQARQVARRRRAAAPEARQRGQARRQDDRGAARRAVGRDAREHRHPPVRPVRGRRLSAAAQTEPRRRDHGAPAYRRVLLKLSGEALMGDLDYGTDPDARAGDRRGGRGGARARRRGRDRRRRRQHLPRARRGREGDGPRDRRLHGHAGHGPERARAAGRAREGRDRDAGAVGDHDLRGRRAVHPPARDAPPREGPDRDLRRRHRQPVLHDRHRGRAARRRAARRGRADGEERRRGRLQRRSGDATPTPSSSRRSPTRTPSPAASR